MRLATSPRSRGLGERAIARAALLVTALGLASCPSEGPPTFLGNVLAIELDAWETVHVTLTANALAVAQANRGVEILAVGPARSTASLRVVPDDPRLEDAAWNGGSIGGPGATVGLRGGDLAALCEPGGECVIGVTLEVLSADEPTTIELRAGLARSGSAGFYGCGAEPREFDAGAMVSAVID